MLVIANLLIYLQKKQVTKKLKKIKSARFVFRLRELTNLSQGKFASKIYVTRPYISQLENDNVDISLSTFIEWCNLFEVDPVFVFDEKKWKL